MLNMGELSLLVGFSIFIFSGAIELTVIKTKLWQTKKITALVIVLFTLIYNYLFLSYSVNFFSLLIAFFSVYSVINNLRFVENRMHKEYLKNVSLKTFVTLFILQFAVIVVWQQNFFIKQISSDYLLTTYAFITLIVALIILFSTIFNLLNTKPRKTAHYTDRDLPTVSLAIPARNENHILINCLKEAIKSNYPKLEIIVLDDCSQDKTAEVIKSFAHDGVRFVQGSQPNDTWLAKNSAYQTLLDEASGDLIIFSGVDVRLHENSIKNAVEHFISLKVKMLSVMPKRKNSGFVAAFIQPARYWWEIAIPRFIINRPPALSSFWIADKNALVKAGGFKSVSRAIIPEEHLAKLFNKNHQYAFLRSDNLMPLFTQKSFYSQWDTAVRTRYPQTHKKPEIVALRSLAILMFIIAPFLLIPLMPFVNTSIISFNILIIISVALYLFSHILISLITNPISALIAPINFPIIMAMDLLATHISLYRYEFGEIIWKGRNVTTAAMHVVPHLPPIDD